MLSGSDFQLLGELPRGSITVLSGELAEFSYNTSSGSTMTREFCPKCSSVLFLKSSRFLNIQMFTISTLERPEEIPPSFEIWTASKLSWSEIDEKIESFAHGEQDDKSLC